MRWWWAAAVLSIAGCGESVTEYVAARRVAAQDQLAKVSRLAGLVRAAKPSEWPTMKDPGPLAICDLVIPAYREAGCNTWVIDLEQLEHPQAFLDPKPLLSYGQADWLVLSKSLIEIGRFPPNASYPDGDIPDRLTRPILYAFQWLESVRYVIVVRTDELVPPKLAEDQKSYTPGSFRGEALLFGLRPAPEALGSVPFSYQMTGELKVRMRRGTINSGQVDKAFADGVRDELAAALVTRLHQLERPPPKPGRIEEQAP